MWWLCRPRPGSRAAHCPATPEQAGSSVHCCAVEAAHGSSGATRSSERRTALMLPREYSWISTSPPSANRCEEPAIQHRARNRGTEQPQGKRDGRWGGGVCLRR